MGNRNSVYVDLDLKDEFMTSAINAHNRYRRLHSCQPLFYANDLSDVAQRIAFYISTRKMDMRKKISKDRHENVVGENVAIKILTKGQDYSGEEITDDWYKEIDHYRGYFTKEPSKQFINDPDSKYFSNFTQMIWKDSKEVGFGKVKANNRMIIVACYRPAGNIAGEYKQNVLPPLVQESSCCCC